MCQAPPQPGRADGAAGPQEQRRHLVDAGHQAVGDRRHRAEQDHRVHHRVVQAQPDHGRRAPRPPTAATAGRTGSGRSRRARTAPGPPAGPSGVPMASGQQEAEQAARDAGPDVVEQGALQPGVLDSSAHTSAGEGSLVGSSTILNEISACQHDQHQHDRDERRQHLLTSERGAERRAPVVDRVSSASSPASRPRQVAVAAPRRRSRPGRVGRSQCWPWRRISPRSSSVISTDRSATAASSMRRGCGMSTVHSRAIRPGPGGQQDDALRRAAPPRARCA